MMEKDLTFEDALTQLETIVQQLETGRIKLDDAVSVYEKATKLKAFCEKKLKNAKMKIEKIEEVKDGEVQTSEFKVEE